MRAAVLRAFGGPEVLRIEHLPDPEPGPGEVVVAVAATAVNHVDIDVREGRSGFAPTWPHVPGTEAAGHIAAVGPGVGGLSVGDPVATLVLQTCGHCLACLAGAENRCRDVTILGCDRAGTYAERVRVAAHRVVRLPPGLTPAAAIAGQKFATAWEALIETGRLRAGETVLVTGAAGGVGSAAVALARFAGARVLGVVGTETKAARIAAVGAEPIVHTQGSVADAALRLTDGEGCALAFDCVGGSATTACLGALAPGGRLVVVGAHAGERVLVDLVDLFRRHLTIHGGGRATRAQIETVYSLLARGAVAPIVAATYPLAAVAEAHRRMEARDFVGRILIDPAAP